MDIPIRRRRQDIAVVATEARVALVRLFALDHPPIVLEGTSALIWELLDGTRDRNGLLGVLTEIFPAEADEDIVAGLGQFIEGLTHLKLLVDESGRPLAEHADG